MIKGYDWFPNKKRLSHILYNWQTSIRGRNEAGGCKRAGGRKRSCSYLLQTSILVQIARDEFWKLKLMSQRKNRRKADK